MMPAPTSKNRPHCPSKPAAWPRIAMSLPAVTVLCTLLTGCGTPYRAEERVSLSAPRPTSKLVIKNSVGSIQLNADASAQEVRAQVSKVGKGHSEQVAQEALDEIAVRLESTDGGATVLAAAEHPGSTSGRGYEVDWVITAPPHVDVDVKNNVGDIHVKGHTRSIAIRGDVGDASISVDAKHSPVTGPATVSIDVGDIHVSGITGGLTAATDVGDVHATAGGKVDVRTDVGDVSLKLLSCSADTVRVNSDVGDVRVSLRHDQQGKLVANCGMGRIHMNLSGSNVKELRERRRFASAQLGDTPQPMIDIDSGVGDITVGTFNP